MRLKTLILAGAALGVAMAQPARADEQAVHPYIVVAPPVRMEQDTRNTQTLFCSDGDFALSAGYWFQRYGRIVPFVYQAGESGSMVPILDADRDGALGYQINVQNDDERVNLFDYIHCLHVEGQQQQVGPSLLPGNALLP